MIIEDRERHFFLRDLAKRLPKSPNPKTVYLWCKKGLLYDRRNPRSIRIKMEYIVRGKDLCSSVEAYWRWIEKFNQE